ncbi:caspase family protein [Methyloglobulus sp.]|uniref:caspase family protein n=1 Tax=Methyloglobulus sp. TaxID=2518622 RepID=UPI0032B6FAEA
MIEHHQNNSVVSVDNHLTRLNRISGIIGLNFNYSRLFPSYFLALRQSHPQNLILTFALLCGLLFSQTSCHAQLSQSEICPVGQAVQSKDGIRRLALLIGVGQYKSPNIPDLLGPPNDVQHFYGLLTNSKGYGFPKENVCVLLNENATTANFKKFFTEALVNRAQEKDEAVVFYAGHGSQAEDTNKDEPDRMDETLVFHDARSDGISDMLDDEFYQLLQQLYAKTHHISVFLDSCNSGTALRGDEGFVARYVAPVKAKKAKRLASPVSRSIDDSATGWVASSLPDAVFFTAASDGTSALEKGGRGIFTDALITTLGQIGPNKLTYAQAALEKLQWLDYKAIT